jgi:hypothetical protein
MGASGLLRFMCCVDRRCELDQDVVGGAVTNWLQRRTVCDNLEHRHAGAFGLRGDIEPRTFNTRVKKSPDAWLDQKPPAFQPFPQARLRTRTENLFITSEVLYQLS